MFCFISFRTTAGPDGSGILPYSTASNADFKVVPLEQRYQILKLLGENRTKLGRVNFLHHRIRPGNRTCVHSALFDELFEPFSVGGTVTTLNGVNVG